MLTHATLTDWKNIKDVNASLNISEERSIRYYLKAASRLIYRYSYRNFFPYYKARDFAIPYNYYDLRPRRYLSADLFLDEDLLEVKTLVNADNTTYVEGTDFFLLEHNIWPKNLVSLKFPATWQQGFTTGSLLHMDQVSVTITGFWGFHDSPLYPTQAWINTLDTITNVGSITASAATFTVADADGTDELGEIRFEEGYMLRIEDELLEVTNVNTSTNTVTVMRGINGSTAATHAQSTIVKRWRVVEDIKEACIQSTKLWREHDEAEGGRRGISETGASVELKLPGDAMNIIRSYNRRPVSNWR